MTEKWHVLLSRDAKKQYIKLRYSGQKKPSIIDVIDAFVIDLSMNGPTLIDWTNCRRQNELFSSLPSKKRQSHLCSLLESR